MKILKFSADCFRLCMLVVLFSLWSRRSNSLCVLSVCRDGSCSLKHIATDQYVSGFPFIVTKKDWRPIKWFWEKLKANGKIEPDWEAYRNKMHLED